MSKALESEAFISKILGKDILMEMNTMQRLTFHVAETQNILHWDDSFDVAITTLSSYSTIRNGPTISPA